MKTLGIDPGLTGAFAVLCDGQPAEFGLLPRIGKKGHHAWGDIARTLDDLGPFDLAVLEHVTAMPSIPATKKGPRRSMGATSAFSFGGSFHGLEAILGALSVPYVLVRPQAWKKAVLAGLNTKEKSSSIAYVRRRWPTVDLRATPRSRTDSDALADAICLALYAHWTLDRKTA